MNRTIAKLSSISTNTTKKLALPLTFFRSLNVGFWDKVQMGPADPILGITEKFNKDQNPKKVNLGVGAYRDDQGKPYILPTVREAEKRIFEAKPNHEYAGILGVPEFVKASQTLLFGDGAEVLGSQKVCSAQALSGTGALRIGAEFCKRFLESKDFYIPDPTWANHIPLLVDSGFNVKTYSYYDSKNIGLDFQNMTKDLEELPKRSNILLHVCAHNPTGVDPSPQQWDELSQICKDKEHFVFFDSAYQGFASGDTEKDVYAVRKFIADGHTPIIATSFAKNFGLYGERVGALHIVTPNNTKKEEVDSQLKILIRPSYSNPPIYGARLVSTILNDSALKQQWYQEVAGMANRIITMRQLLVDYLKKNGSQKNWSHITSQIGMFCFSGLKPEQVDKLANDYSIYLVRSGRISIAGITSHNVEYLAKAMHEVTK